MVIFKALISTQNLTQASKLKNLRSLKFCLVGHKITFEIFFVNKHEIAASKRDKLLRLKSGRQVSRYEPNWISRFLICRNFLFGLLGFFLSRSPDFHYETTRV